MKCPKCLNDMVEIIYGMPVPETFEKFKNKEVYIGGCEVIVGIKQPKYHCYKCDESFVDGVTEEELKEIKEKSLEEIIGFDIFETDEEKDK